LIQIEFLLLDVRDESWLCENALATASVRHGLGDVAKHDDFVEFGEFPLWNSPSMR
jgi:hypothetical protein